MMLVMKRWMRWLLWLTELAITAACGGEKPAVTTTSTATTRTTTAAASPSTSTATASSGAQQVTATPNSQLKDGQVVHMVAAGFTPGQTLGVLECADKGDQTGQGDCNLGGLQTARADAKGMVVADLHVVVGPFGSNRIVCSASQKCLVSVSQLVPSPAEVGTAEISFG
jgi:hypothetical protein